MRNRPSCRRGFAIREILVALLVVASMAGLVARKVASTSAGVAATACQENMARTNLAIEKWFFDKGRWPEDDLSDIGSDLAYFPDGPPRCPVTGELYEVDPITHRVLPHPH